MVVEVVVGHVFVEYEFFNLGRAVVMQMLRVFIPYESVSHTMHDESRALNLLNQF